MSSWQIRPYRQQDAAFRAAVAQRLHPGETVSPRDPRLIAEFLDRFGRGEIATPAGAGMFVAVDETDAPVGLLVLHAEQDYFTKHPRAYVDFLVVAEHAEGKGVGRALMDHADGWARDHQCIEVCLDVFANNASAIAFYQRNGFQEDTKRMAKAIAPANADTA